MSDPQAEVAPVTTTPPTDPVQTNQQNIQVNIASSSYGLYYRLVLHRIFPGAL